MKRLTYSDSDLPVLLGDSVIWGDDNPAVVVFVVGTEFEWRPDLIDHKEYWTTECGAGAMVEIAGPQLVFCPSDSLDITLVSRASSK